MRRFHGHSFGSESQLTLRVTQDATHANDLLAITEEQQAEVADLDEEVLRLTCHFGAAEPNRLPVTGATRARCRSECCICEAGCPSER